MIQLIKIIKNVNLKKKLKKGIKFEAYKIKVDNISKSKNYNLKRMKQKKQK